MNSRRVLSSLSIAAWGCALAFIVLALPSESASAAGAGAAAKSSREATFKKAQAIREEGVALLDAKDFEKAKAKFEEALALKADSDGLNSDLHQRMAEVCLETESYQEGVKHCDLALQFNPTSWTTMHALSRLYAELGDLNQAMSWAKKALKVAAEPDDLRYVRSSIQGDVAKKCEPLLHEGEFAKAQQFLTEAASFDPSDGTAWVHACLADIYLHQGEPNKAMSENQIALKMQPNNTMALMNQAEGHAYLGQFGEAQTWAKKALQEELDPGEQQSMESLLTEMKPMLASPALNDPKAADYLDSNVVPVEGKICPWPPGRMPLKVFIQPASSVAGYRDSFRQVIVESLDAWVKASGGRISYELCSEPKHADIICRWVSSPEELECTDAGHAQGYTVCPWQADKTGKAFVKGPVSIKLLTRPLHDRKVLTDSQMKVVSLHEVGHALGISPHSPLVTDIMGYSSLLDTPDPRLTARDTATLIRLYTQDK